jgi:succinate-semialdehyde dehydrogenase/glutarate-semialdehyde dehydrogenase
MKFGYLPLYIDGELRDAVSGERHQVICPATDEVIAEVAKAGPEDARIALESAQGAFETWSQLPLEVRAEWLMKLKEAISENREQIQEALMYETGKIWEQAELEPGLLMQSLDYCCECMRRQQAESLPDPDGDCTHELRYEPLGVVVSYLPWNFPLETMSFKMGSALITGCTIVIKPSPETPVSAYLIGKLCHDIGFPKGVVSFMYGDNDVLPPALSGSTIPSLLSAVGSFATGRRIVDQGNTSLKRYCFELGGNAPAIVFDDADKDLAQGIICGFKLFNTGQICIAPNRVFLHKSIAPEMKKRFVEGFANQKLAFGKDSGATAGPLIHKEARDRIQSWVDEAVEKGAEIVVGGDLSGIPDKGSFYPPTIVKGVTPDMQLYNGEIFGPVISIIEFEDEDEVLKMANDTQAGLSSFIFTESDDRIDRFSRDLEFGEVMVNAVKYTPYLPHLGIKQSGIGMVGSEKALHEFQRMKRVTRRAG